MTSRTAFALEICALFSLAITSGSCAPCRSNEDCDGTEYCSKTLNNCEGVGSCQVRPDACTEQYEPVCGCDGSTYGNACLAAAEGVTILYEGECEPEYCWSNRECGDNEYCFFADCDQETGACKDRPEACPDIWIPVCGCDGKTYSNDCYAARAGMSVAYQGECKPAGCFSIDDCGADQYCNFPGCLVETGTCEDRPDACPDIWDPVCGCDAVTYGNACEAAAEGMSIEYEGECESRPVRCRSNAGCSPDAYCHVDDCNLDTGICEARPELCLAIWIPVCGCNGLTYSNSCYAAGDGMNVDYEGECAW